MSLTSSSWVNYKATIFVWIAALLLTHSHGAHGQQKPAKTTDPTSSTWKARTTQNPMTDEVSTILHTSLPGNPRGSFSATASCHRSTVAGISSRAVELVIEPSAGASTFRLTHYEGERHLSFFGDSSTADADYDCAVLGVRVGTGNPFSTKSDSCNSRRSVSLSFGEDYAVLSAKFTAMAHPGSSDKDDSLAGFLSALTTAVGTMGAAAGGSRNGELQLSDVIGANRIRVQLPLADGDDPVVTVPLDAEFKNFATACVPKAMPRLENKAAAPPPPPAPKAPPTHNPDGLIYGTPADLKDRTFTGTVDQFAAALPGFISRAGASGGWTADKFPEGIKAVIDHIRTCERITPETVASFPHFINQMTGKQDYRATDPYNYCDMPGNPLGVSSNSLLRIQHGAEEGQRLLSVQTVPIGPLGSGAGFHVYVGFTRLNEDMVLGPGADFYDPAKKPLLIEKNRIARQIVDATILPGPSVAGDSSPPRSDLPAPPAPMAPADAEVTLPHTLDGSGSPVTGLAGNRAFTGTNEEFFSALHDALTRVAGNSTEYAGLESYIYGHVRHCLDFERAVLSNARYRKEQTGQLSPPSTGLYTDCYMTSAGENVQTMQHSLHPEKTDRALMMFIAPRFDGPGYKVRVWLAGNPVVSGMTNGAIRTATSSTQTIIDATVLPSTLSR